jgi:thioredoxin reductase
MLGKRKSIAIVGAGPVGLAAAAHALERGHDPIVFEAGPEIGHAVRQWSHVRMFSPWEYNVDKAAGRLLADTGWNSPDPDRNPTGGELVERYLVPLSQRTPLCERIKTSAAVTAISRVGFDKLRTTGRESAPFEVRYRNGAEKTMLADAVVDASGSWFSPNPAGANGLPALGEREVEDRVLYGMPDVRGKMRRRFSGKKVAVVGSGHSAIGNLIELVHLRDEEPDTRVIWILRGDNPEKAFGGGANDKLVARGELGSLFARYVKSGSVEVISGFRTTHISRADKGLRIGAGTACCGRQIVVDELIISAGFRPDLTILRELRISLDAAVEAPPALAPLIDPNLHSCGTVRPHGARELSHPEPGFYIAGMKSYGRAPTFLMLTGYEQVRSIVADIAGDSEAAERVELVLPDTGVCSLTPSSGAAEACCGGAPQSDASARCAADESAKASGAGGCGCGSM